MAKVAKIVWASVGTRVIVDENATDEQVWEIAKDNLVRNLVRSGLDNVDKIALDTEVPYGTLDDEKQISKYRILHNVDGEKITELKDDVALIEFMERIAQENEEDDCDAYPALCDCKYSRAMDYLLNHCPNLTLL